MFADRFVLVIALPVKCAELHVEESNGYGLSIPLAALNDRSRLRGRLLWAKFGGQRRGEGWQLPARHTAGEPNGYRPRRSRTARSPTRVEVELPVLARQGVLHYHHGEAVGSSGSKEALLSVTTQRVLKTRVGSYSPAGWNSPPLMLTIVSPSTEK